MSGLLLGHFPETASKLGTQEQNKELAWGAQGKKNSSPRWYHGCWCARAAAPNRYRARRGLVLGAGLCGGAHESDAGRRGTLARLQIRKVSKNRVEAAIAEVQLYWCWAVE